MELDDFMKLGVAKSKTRKQIYNSFFLLFDFILFIYNFIIFEIMHWTIPKGFETSSRYDFSELAVTTL